MCARTQQGRLSIPSVFCLFPNLGPRSHVYFFPPSSRPPAISMNTANPRNVAPASATQRENGARGLRQAPGRDGRVGARTKTECNARVIRAMRVSPRGDEQPQPANNHRRVEPRRKSGDCGCGTAGDGPGKGTKSRR